MSRNTLIVWNVILTMAVLMMFLRLVDLGNTVNVLWEETISASANASVAIEEIKDIYKLLGGLQEAVLKLREV